MFFSMLTNAGTLAECMDKLMGLSWVVGDREC
jgi:hypothetical protein